MKRTLAALILTTALATPLVAQETPLSGTVAEIFGTQIVLTTPEGRLLVTLPEGATDGRHLCRCHPDGRPRRRSGRGDAARRAARPWPDRYPQPPR